MEKIDKKNEMPVQTGNKILIVDDDPHMRSALSLSLKKTGKEGDIFASAEDALNYLSKNITLGEKALESEIYPSPYFLILSDLNMPGMDGISFLREIKKYPVFQSIPFVIITAYGTIESAVSAMKSGASDYMLKPFDISDFERIVKNAEKISYSDIFKRTVKDNADAVNFKDINSSNFIYRSAAMKRIDEYIKAVAAADATVLITGESGTGKEVAAKRIHELSGRKGRFVAVNCSAIVPTLLESELFGHEKGAFTGAVSLKKGKFEQADGGTIFLDEIAEMDKNLQAKILRALQEKTIDRVGGDEPVSVNARVVAATNKDIEKAVSEGNFRDDLFYRLNVIRLHMPPLRDRKEDIIALAEYFTSVYSKKYFRDVSGISEDARKYLLSLDFQGNIRELENIIERAVILAQKDKFLDVRHFGNFEPAFYDGFNSNGRNAGGKSDEDKNIADNTDISGTGDAITNVTDNNESDSFNGSVSSHEVVENRTAGDILSGYAGRSLNIKEMEEKLILTALKETGGNKTKAAEKLGITSRTLRNKLKELGIN
ncbi:MAG: sigma-54 dependent transcriptional regulator [Deltaproteobacteria bacterium]|jgi:DNA-binding NtrC family response regulator|nr:sigma-54 dependent transcriptional regulator [Deltaproteobacteria bacterium]